MSGRDHRFQPRAAVLVWQCWWVVAGCTDFGDPIRPPAPRPAAVTITSPSGPSADRTVGAKLQFTAVVQDDRGGTVPDAEIHWESSAPVTLQIVYDGADYVTPVQPIFDANGVSCHGRNGGPNLAAAASYANLVNVRANGSALQRVQPSDPGNSDLYVKITGLCPGPLCSGGRMPAGLPPLPAAVIQVIHDWIAGGASR